MTATKKMTGSTTRSLAALPGGKRAVKGDRPLLFAVIALSLYGLVFVYSASKYTAEANYGNSFFIAQKHLTGLLIGYAAMLFGCFFDYTRFKKLSLFLPAIAIALLALVFTPLGASNYGATRWIKVGPVTVQPSETAKICYVLFCASYFSKNPAKIKKFTGILPILAVGGAICVCIILEPNMSITVCFGLLMLAILFAAGVRLRHFAAILVPAALSVPVLIIAEPYRLNRLSAFLNPWASPKGEGYQLLQSLYALGSGGWFGVGLFNSRQKFKFLPFSESDFILAVIGEETGFIGMAILLALVLFIFFRGLTVASKAKDPFGYMIAVGVSSIFLIQSLVNVLVVTGSIPPTGLPFPLVSAGNTSVIVFLFSFGILYNVSKSEV